MKAERPIEEGDLMAGGEAIPEAESIDQSDDPFAKGRERMAAVSDFVESSRESVASMASKVGGGISRFWERAKNFGGEAVAATLSVDDLAAKGKKKFEKMVVAGDDYLNKKAEDLGYYAGTKLMEGVDWTKRKGESVKRFAQDKLELGKDIAFLAKEKTVEGLHSVENGIKQRYDGIKSFGESAVSRAKGEVMRLNDAWREKMNSIRLRRLIAEYEKAAKDHSEASERARELAKKKADLVSKIDLLNGLNMVS